jgi:hypothetical protein
VSDNEIAAETVRLQQRLSGVHAAVSRRIAGVEGMIRRLERLPFVPPDHPLPWRIDAERQRIRALYENAKWAAQPFFDCLRSADPSAYGLFMDLKETDLLTDACLAWLYRTFGGRDGILTATRSTNAEVARRLDAIEPEL